MRTTQTNDQTITEAAPAGMWGIVRASIVLFAILTVVTGIVYPLAMTAVGKAAFANQAGGSLIDKDGKPTDDESKAVGSSLIGQTFDQPYYFWSRPSATSPMAYNASSSSGSNLGPMGIADTVKGRVDALKAADKDAGVANSAQVPVDLVTASGSGLDPEESVAAAMYQVPRIAHLRSAKAEDVEALIRQNAHGPMLGVFGEQAVNVLALNLALDKLAPAPASAPATAATRP